MVCFIQPIKNGGYISAGATYPGNGGITQNIWVVKTDSLGISTGVTPLHETIVNGMTVYPNPSNGVFTVALSHAELVSASQTTIEIYNVLGEEVYSRSAQADDNTINLSNQPNGMYLYRVITESGSLIGEGKLVIQR